MKYFKIWAEVEHTDCDNGSHVFDLGGVYKQELMSLEGAEAVILAKIADKGYKVLHHHVFETTARNCADLSTFSD